MGSTNVKAVMFDSRARNWHADTVRSASLYTSGASVDWAYRLVGADTEREDLLAAAAVAPTGSLGVGFIPHLR